jgi:hypothetical protein
MSFTLIVVHLGARMNPLTLSVLLPSVKSITVRAVCLLQCGQYIARCRPDFVCFLNLINGSHGFVCDANPSSVFDWVHLVEICRMSEYILFSIIII